MKGLNVSLAGLKMWLNEGAGADYERVGPEEQLDDGAVQEKRSLVQSSQWRKSSTYPVALYLAACLFLSSLILFGAAFALLMRARSPHEVLVNMNAYSPLLDTFQFRFSKTKVNGSLFNDPFSIYRADPSPDVDAAWEKISMTRPQVLSREEVLKMGKDPSLAVRVPEEWGYGTDKYFGIINGQHLLHCVDMVRRFAYYDYYYLEKWGRMDKIPAAHAAHRSHCIGAILDALRCQPSVEMFTYVWMDNQENPYPDFGIWRQCSNHNELVEWQESNMIPQELTDGDIARPEEAKQVKGLWQLDALNGWTPNGTFPR